MVQKRIKARKKALLDWVLEYKKQRGCSICGERFPYCLGFHHRDGGQKEDTIANMVGHGFSKKRILAEVEKCILVCANCHSKIHFSTGL